MKYTKVYDHSTEFTHTYNVYNQTNGYYVGILVLFIEKDCFGGWHFDGEYKPKHFLKNCEFKKFDTEEEAMRFITEDFTK